MSSPRSRSPYAPLFDRPAPARPEAPGAPAPRTAQVSRPHPEDRPREEVLSVHEFVGRLQQRVHGLGQVTVEGEVVGFKGPQPTTGHLYFTLKDARAEASLSCAMFRREAAYGGGERVVNGARVRVRAAADVYAPRGALQLMVSRVAAAGEGDHAARREALKRKLEAEGLFDPRRKRRLPSEPRVVGVVTSASGAAFHDIVKVARRRAQVRILLSPAMVQGEGAPLQLRRALERLARVDEVDVIILGRGGGSAEDLAAFDDEELARAVAACPKPVVAAVGHEVDWSIVCLVADVRAATPSQAAELAVPDHAARRQRLDDALRRLALAQRGRLRRAAIELARLDKRVRAPERALSRRRQQVDELAERLVGLVKARLVEERRRTDALERRLAARHPRAVLADARRALAPLPVRLGAAMRHLLSVRRGDLGATAQKLQAISPLAVLGRGYAITLDASGRAVRDAREVQAGDRVQVRLDRGALEAIVDKVRAP